MPSIHIPPPWTIPERLTTPESAYLDRRQIVKALGLGALGLGTLSGRELLAPGSAAAEPPKTGGLAKAAVDRSGMLRPAIGRQFASRFPAERNTMYAVGDDRTVTPEERACSHNNFYEFTTDKQRVWELAQDYRLGPWQVEVSGLVKQERTLDLIDLFTRFDLEERLYRFRCVERWSMQVPWTGFPLATLINYLEPLPSARFVKFTSINDAEGMPGIKRYSWYPWPYYEALRLDEATNPLAFVALGIFGQALPMQHGAPWRVVMPWKYGYKSPKSIVAIEFTKRRPETFWHEAQPDEYGFFSNCDPGRPHPRWSQEWEQDIGTQENRPTLLYNGYAEEVSSMYKGNEI